MSLKDGNTLKFSISFSLWVEGPKSDFVVFCTGYDEAFEKVYRNDDVGVTLIKFYYTCNSIHEFQTFRVGAENGLFVFVNELSINDFIKVQTM